MVEGCSSWSYQAGGQRGRSKKRFMDVVREDREIVGVTEEDVEMWQGK